MKFTLICLCYYSYVTSWIDRREVQSEKANLMVLFDKYIPTLQDILRVRFKKITPMPEISHLMMLCQLLDCLLTPDNAPPDSPKEVYEQYFVFAAVWAFGSALYQDGVSVIIYRFSLMPRPRRPYGRSDSQF